jgi:two-component system, chemotaxis family, chemotaxis protein CheY
MQIRTGLSNLIAALACGRSSTATAPPALPTADERPRDQDASSGAGEQLELTLAGHLLIPVAVFVIAVPTIDLSHGAKSITTVWLANAVILAALLRHVRSLSFLIVDDQQFTRRIVRSILLGFGSREVHESANGAEGFELARAAMPSIIITDLVMPLFDGLKFIAMVKSPDSPTHGIPIIVLSGYLTKTAALAVTEHGAAELLVKPVSPKALHGHISRIMLRSDEANPAAALLQNQKKRAELQRRQSSGTAFL